MSLSFWFQLLHIGPYLNFKVLQFLVVVQNVFNVDLGGFDFFPVKGSSLTLVSFTFPY